ncbi:uncharacterized protein LOC118436265 isoform X2 [Folsomia candida]|uniref:uncharacterized protein LOC118436265 isoform X2 n=1 Tax=Folsomia candida TaxID=158441 RepID=UPI00160504CE|nr:uncharacterized protein LOC118436265 isoform X2 [Folsomia candida]
MIAYMHLTDKTATNLSLRSEYSPKVSTMEKVARSVEFKVSSGGIFDRIDNYGVKTDFNLITKNTIFRGHKSFFGACSNYLLELFLKSPSCPVMYIMEDVRPVDLENLFAFVYEGKITVKPNQSEGLLRAANQLKIDSLVKQLEKPSLNKVPTIRLDQTFSRMPNLSIQDPLPNVTKSCVPRPSPEFPMEPLNDIGSSTSSSSGKIFAFKAPFVVGKPISNNDEHDVVPPQAPPQDLQKSKIKVNNEKTSTTVVVKRGGQLKGQPRVATPFPSCSSPLQPGHAIHGDGAKMKGFDRVRMEIGSPLFSSTKLGPESLQVEEQFQKKEQIIVTEKAEPVRNIVAWSYEAGETNESGRVSSERVDMHPPTKLEAAGTFQVLNDQIAHSSTVAKFSLHDLMRIESNVNNSTMNCPPPAVESTLPDHELRKGSQEVFTSTKKLLPTAKVTDCDSSDDSFYIKLRRKLPAGKRRRIPASTRPMIINSSSSSNMESVHMRSKRRKPRSKLR